MPHYFIRKLEQFTKLSRSDRQALENAAGQRRTVAKHSDIISEGDDPHHVNLILDGWACRYKQLDDGRRQIIAFFVPGDLCDSHVYILREMDHSIVALTPVRLAEISRATLERMADDHGRVTKALWWDTLVTVAVQREWTVNLGQRTALERLGHLFCEVFLRLRGVGLTDGATCDFPLTQVELADALGLSNVHINRTLQELRRAGLIGLKGGRLTIPDFDALQRASLFNPNYLHLDHEGRLFDADGPV
ncbi:Crp/Fnr family transcriptional regulator [Methylobacterium sp. E-045]|uniref:Crp/Fnr family transcriptional regulator n=1 Tax=Methylobacterium sp. E-045 TaxID=2836575 RepID=UPI001FBBAFD5|nr:Crp/Fnr family transcriptional regulator [Methylobacterium sp. E-045]MCJ2131680.1 Crp/Fnr family transcriptional regulator [Methylobacterium sp. E-045]